MEMFTKKMAKEIIEMSKYDWNYLLTQIGDLYYPLSGVERKKFRRFYDACQRYHIRRRQA